VYWNAIPKDKLPKDAGAGDLLVGTVKYDKKSKGYELLYHLAPNPIPPKKYSPLCVPKFFFSFFFFFFSFPTPFSFLRHCEFIVMDQPHPRLSMLMWS